MDVAPFEGFENFTEINPRANLADARYRYLAVHACKLKAV